MAEDFDYDDDTCSLLVPVDVLGTPGVLQSVTAGEGAFSRASVGTYYDSSGVLQTAAVDVKRVTYNPANLMQEPYDLIEGAATNSIRNNTMQGAVVGTPGTIPATWGPTDSATNGITRSVIAVGVESGIDYIDLRYQGAATAFSAMFVRFNPANDVPTSLGQKWVHSSFHKVLSAGPNLPSIREFITERNGATSSVGIAETVISPGSLIQRYSMQYTIASSDAVSVYSGVSFQFQSGLAYDFTIRIGLPQLERDQVTSPIRTTNAAATRAADVIGPAPALAEDTNPLWASGTTYAADATVYKGNRVYASTGKAGNTNKDPAVPANQYNPDGTANFWVDIGPTNRSAMFDGLISTPTSAASPLRVTLTPGAFNGFALFGIDADTYEVVVKDEPGGNVIYSEPVTALEGSMPGDYYEYFFDRFKPLTQLIRSGIEPYAPSEITLTLRKATGPIKLGMFAIGDLKPVGLPQREAVVNPGSFSYFKQDAFGNATVRKRPNYTGMDIPCVTGIENANTIKADIDYVAGIPCVVIGSEKPLYEWMTTFGLVTAQMIPGPYPDVTVKLNVKGFI